MRTGLTSLGVVLCLLGVYALAAEDMDNAPVAKPCVSITGANSHVSERSCHRITSMDEWAKVWQKHKGQNADDKYDYYDDPLELPLVDFEKYMVIGIFQGSGMNSAGLKAVSVSEQDDCVVLRFDDKSYQTEGPKGGGKKVSAYGFFVIPRSPKTVVLEEDAQRLLGEPPLWKVRIKFEKLHEK